VDVVCGTINAASQMFGAAGTESFWYFWKSRSTVFKCWCYQIKG